MPGPMTVDELVRQLKQYKGEAEIILHSQMTVRKVVWDKNEKKVRLVTMNLF